MVSSAMRPLLGRPIRSAVRGTGLGILVTADGSSPQVSCRAGAPLHDQPAGDAGDCGLEARARARC
jgi:hypothetical protein